MTDGPNPAFFLDRNLGRKTVPTLLRDAGLVVEVTDDHFAPDTPDEVWLEEVGKRGWFVVTLDEKIRYRRGEQEAVRRFNVGLFLLVRWKGSTGLGYAAAQGKEGVVAPHGATGAAFHREGLRRRQGESVAEAGCRRDAAPVTTAPPARGWPSGDTLTVAGRSCGCLAGRGRGAACPLPPPSARPEPRSTKRFSRRMSATRGRVVTERLYPGLTREALIAREAALERFAAWKAAHPVVLPATAAIAAVAALYEMLPAESRRRAPDPSGVMTFHALMARAAPPTR